MPKDINNILYVYLQRKLLEAANGIQAKRGFLTEEDRIRAIDELKENGKLNTVLPFSEAKQVLNYWHNISKKIVVPTLYVMRDLKLIEINGVTNHMTVKIINLKRGNLISQSNKLYSICL